jgi:hypothetical protein
MLRGAPWVVLAIVVAHLAGAWYMRIAGFGWGEDDAGYLLLAQELRHFSYRDVQDVLAPMHARFPPGFPLLLALVGPLVGDSVDALIGVVALCSAGSIFLLYAAARSRVGDEVAVLCALLYAINPITLQYAGILMAEAPFRLLVTTALWALTREDDSPWFAVLAGGATCAAALTRSAGVVFIVALMVYWVTQRRYRRAMLLGVAAALTVGAWLAYTFTAPDPETRRLYVADLGARQQRGDRPGMIEEIVRRLVPRTRLYLQRFVPSTLAVPTVPGTPIDNVFWSAALVILGTTGLVGLWRRWRAATWFVLAYIGLLAIWRWALERFIDPIIPLLFLVLLTGAATLAGSVRPERRRALLGVLSLLLVVGALQDVVPYFQRYAACDRGDPAGSPTCWPRGEREYLRAAQWVRDSTPTDAIFFVSKERSFFMHTGRRSINQDRGLQEDSLSLVPYLRSRGVTYSVVTPVGVRSQMHNALLATSCRGLALVREFSPSTFLLRVRGADESADVDDSCARIRRFATPSPDEE